MRLLDSHDREETIREAQLSKIKKDTMFCLKADRNRNKKLEGYEYLVSCHVRPTQKTNDPFLIII